MTYEDVEDCAVFGVEVTVGDDDYEIVEGGVNGTGDSGGAEEVLVTDRFETQEAQVMAAAFGIRRCVCTFGIDLPCSLLELEMAIDVSDVCDD